MVSIISWRAPTTTLRRHIEALSQHAARFEPRRKKQARRFKEFFDGRQLEPRRADRRPCRAARKSPTHASSSPTSSPQRPRTLRDVYCQRASGKPHQVLKTHLRPIAPRAPSHSQPAPAVSARQRVLLRGLRVSMPSARCARRAVRYVAPAAHQSRCSRRRDETMIRIYLPTSCPAQDILRLVSAYPAPRHLTGAAPRMSSPSRQPENILLPAFCSLPRSGAFATTKTANNHAYAKRRNFQRCIPGMSWPAKLV